MIDKSAIDKFFRLKEQAEQKARKAERAKGAMDQLSAQLKSEFGCVSLEAADKMIAKMRKDGERSKIEFDDAIEGFEERWSEKLK